MALPRGSKLGPYEIVGPLGAGGMGEVYEARDTRLDRTVAVKVLPAHLSSDAGFRQRFEREARSVSSLNHPHICTLYDIGREDEVDFLVMEFLEGETLDARLQRGPLPLAELLRVGVQVAEALAVAHASGFVHRDLKPGNIMLTKAGAKLLDFGLAKATESGPVGSPMTAAPTATTPLTATGMILGTFQYMAPEQLDGSPADARSDIFALGAVLYEAAAGQRPFQGKTQASLIAAILKEEPRPLSQISSVTPPALERTVAKCLAKDPEERWQSARDLADQLRWLSEERPEATAAMAGAAAGRAPSSRIAWSTAALFALLSLLLAVGRIGDGTVPAPGAIRFQVTPPEGTTFRAMGRNAGPVAVSPDGRMLVFAALEPDGHNRLWIRELGSLEARPLDDTQGAARPFWSPDSRNVAFFAGGELRRIDAGGGPALAICSASAGRGGTWGPDDVILFSPSAGSAIFRVHAGGGEPEPVTELGEHASHRYPRFLPDGRGFLYLALSQQGVSGTEAASQNRVYAARLEGGEATLLVQGAANAEFAEGHLLFLRGTDLMAQPFDPDALRLTGDALVLTDEVQYDAPFERGLFSAAGGVLAYMSGSYRGETQMQWFDPSGESLGTVGELATQNSPALSADGRRLALDATDPETGNTDIWIYELDRNVRTRFTFDAATNVMPQWSPDGKRIYFSAAPADDLDLYVKSASGTGSAELLLDTEGDTYATSWSADGRYVTFSTRDSSTGWDIFALEVDAGADPIPLSASRYDESWARISPDGRWLSYTSNESGRSEVYVAPFPSLDGKWQVSPEGGTEAIWHPEGDRLYYRTPSNALVEVEIRTAGGALEVGLARPLFSAPTPPEGSGGSTYTLAPDGKRFLFNVVPESDLGQALTVVVNWAADLR